MGKTDRRYEVEPVSNSMESKIQAIASRIKELRLISGISPEEMAKVKNWVDEIKASLV